MNTRLKNLGLASAVALLAVAAVPAVPAAAADAPSVAPSAGASAGAIDYERMMGEKSPAIVTVKFVMKIEMGGRDQEQDTEVTGVMIDPKGLVMCSNMQLGGYADMMRRRGMEATITPTDIKVLVGEDTEGVKAKIVARDRELDLCWLRIDEVAADKKYTAVEMSTAAGGKLGQKVFCVDRMPKYFDRVATINEGRIGGVTKKPRRLLVPTGLSADLGMPIFATDGGLIGFMVLQLPDAEDGDEGGASMRNPMPLILPAEEAAKATERALASAKAGGEGADAKDEGKGAEAKADPGAKKDAPAPPEKK